MENTRPFTCVSFSSFQNELRRYETPNCARATNNGGVLHTANTHHHVHAPSAHAHAQQNGALASSSLIQVETPTVGSGNNCCAKCNNTNFSSSNGSGSSPYRTTDFSLAESLADETRSLSSGYFEKVGRLCLKYFKL